MLRREYTPYDDRVDPIIDIMNIDDVGIIIRYVTWWAPQIERVVIYRVLHVPPPTIMPTWPSLAAATHAGLPPSSPSIGAKVG